MDNIRRTEVRVGDVSRLFDGRRLALARHLAGLRKNALAAKIEKSPTAVAGYENNSKRPAPATVAQLCLTLGVDPGFFLPGPQSSFEFEALPHFRSLRTTSQLVRDQAFAYAVVVNDIGMTLERHVEFPSVNIPRLSVDVDDKESDLPEQAARLLRKHWNVVSGPMGHLVRLAENSGVVVVFSPCQTASVDAYSLEGRHRPVIILNPTKNDYFRQRFDVAHELGHLVMHVDAEPGSRIVEAQANRFAAELLMPTEELSDVLPAKADWQTLGRLKEEWRVSLQALLYRSRQLGVMKDVTYRNAMAFLSSKGWKRREPGPMPTLEQPSLFSKAVDILDSVGVGGAALAQEAKVPMNLFRVVTSRNPSRDGAAESDSLDEYAQEGPSGVVSLFESRA